MSTTERWAVARAWPDRQPDWLAGFAAGRPIWAAGIDAAELHDRDGAEAAVGRCVEAPDRHHGHYAACRLR